MSKPTELSLLLPGPRGWELWKEGSDGLCSRLSSGPGPAEAGEMEGLPGENLAMLFPVKALQALPLRTETTDPALFSDLAVMHAERMGIRPDPMAGRLSDTFVVDREGAETVLLHVAVKNPAAEEMPARTPKEFDISPRAYPGEGDEVCLWRELGHWVFAIHHAGKLLYFQGTLSAEDEPGADVVQEIQLALSQLGIQGLPAAPVRVRVWTEPGEVLAAPVLVRMFPGGVLVELRPDPVIPHPLSKILPEDVRMARRQRRERQQILAGVAAVALIYLGIVGWMLFGVFKDMRQKGKLERQAAGVANVSAQFEAHRSKWSDLSPVVDVNRSPMEIMRQIQSCIPPNSGLRLKTAEINLPENSIQLSGVAQTSAPVNAFSLALKKNPELSSWLQWDNTAPNKTKDGWEFRYTATSIDKNPVQ